MLLHLTRRTFARAAFTTALAACADSTRAVLPAMDTPAAILTTGPEWGPWSQPVNLVSVNSPSVDNQPTLSRDELSLYFTSSRSGGLGGNDIWVSRRLSVDSAWGTPVNLGAPVNSSSNDQGPALSPNGLMLFFHSERAGGFGAQDIYVVRRTDATDDFNWGAPHNLGSEVNTTNFEASAFYLPQVDDGPVSLYFGRGPTSVDIDMYSIGFTPNGQTLGEAARVSELNYHSAGVTDARPTVRADGKEVIFFSTRPGGFGLADLWMSVRPNAHAPWSSPTNLGASVNTEFVDRTPWLSADGRTLLFSSNRPGGVGDSDIWMSTRERLDGSSP